MHVEDIGTCQEKIPLNLLIASSHSFNPATFARDIGTSLHVRNFVTQKSYC